MQSTKNPGHIHIIYFVDETHLTNQKVTQGIQPV